MKSVFPIWRLWRFLFSILEKKGEAGRAAAIYETLGRIRGFTGKKYRGLEFQRYLAPSQKVGSEGCCVGK